ncbi:NAD(P)-binding Rossmann-fold containing protein [Glarea lozoyensis ATCC 20868]|uniref:NAD(P)-binding Rossmann-fold containing protein n=1 Tax=Glarea lozoyensis (strain ATCC 20868 / MF5171) TaxID=1116229 RepID=S3DSF2_GLAL2|nr:NAD(P)-binding Rossmann-fold containing protein [Glarea lozoyensis ATCC 20868]EPE34886.1 NAD(P)-binding Rossmann-fold containing protein [Glarea lozoyensis ATCC 20868]
MAPAAETATSTPQDTQTQPYDAARPYAGRVALITGSGRGIGRGMALELASRGASVVVNYAKSASAAESVVSEIKKFGSKGIAIQADVSKPAEIVRLFDDAIAHFGRLDFVISNSGTEVWSKEEDVTPEDFDYIFNLNCRGQFFVAQQGLKHLGQGGRIILMSSIAAQMSGIPNHALYAGSKAAVEGFARSFAVDCGHKGVTVNAIAPGGIKTDMFDANAWHYVPNGTPDMSMEIIEKGIARFCPLQRCGVPADIAKAVALLVSPDSEWINGQVIRLSGGGV